MMQWGLLGMGVCWIVMAPCYKIGHEEHSRIYTVSQQINTTP
jgi:hypothetical protein